MKSKNAHPGSPTNLPPDAPRASVAVEFGRRLQSAMSAKGWSQADLARRAQENAPGGVRIARDNISTYINGKVLPNPTRVGILAKVLGVDEQDLLPSRGVTLGSEKVPAFDMRALSDGRVWLRINQAVPTQAALSILSVLDRLETEGKPVSNSLRAEGKEA